MTNWKSMPHPEPPRPVATSRRFPWRRLFQYRLRTLLVVTTIVAALFAWWSHNARQQREAALINHRNWRKRPWN